MKTMTEMWEQYCGNSLPRDYPEVVKAEVKLAFHAAIFVLLTEIKLLADGRGVDAAVFQVSDLIDDAGQSLLETMRSRGGNNPVTEQHILEVKDYFSQFEKARLNDEEVRVPDSGLKPLLDWMPALTGALGDLAGTIAGEDVKVGAVMITQNGAVYGANCETQTEMLDVLRTALEVMRQSLRKPGQTRH